MFSSFGNTSNASGGNLFGNTSQQPQQQGGTGGNLFGGFGSAGSSTQPAASGSSLFGNTAQQAPATGSTSLFGNTAGTPATGGTTGGGLFGNASNQGGGLFGTTSNQQQPGGGGGLFGNTQSQPASTGLFGTQSNTNTSTAPGGSSLFGTTPVNTTGNLFGNPSTNSNTSGSGLFGNTGSSNTNTAGGGLFGNTNTTGGVLFGNAAGATNTNTMGGGLFGNPAGGPNSNTAGSGLFGSTLGGSNTNATGGGPFGTSNANTTGSGLFGNTASTPANTTGGGLFGNTSNAPSTSGGSLFGGQPNNPPFLFGISSQNQQPGSMLGQPPPQQRQGSLFGNLGQSSTASGDTLHRSNTLGRSTLFGSTANNLLSSRATVASGYQQADAQSQFTSLNQRIEDIAQAWDPTSPRCRFQHFFYNLVDPSQVHLYGRPSNATNDALWQKAVRENPDSSCLVPVIATGLDDLQKRVEAQSQQAAGHQEKLKELQTRIVALSQRHQLSNASRLHRAAALQTQLTHRVLKVVQHLHLLIPALRSSAIRPEEEALRAALEDIDQEIRRPGGIGRMRGKLNELWALVGAVNAARERDRKAGAVEWAVVDDEGLGQIVQILAEEQTGLAHVTKILQQDMKDLAVIHGTSVPEQDPDALLNSTSALRGSTVY
ncbi:hypothetical protein AcV5_009647 [Taiwanofungus camphoratus]|nr:hypothetical protein AcV5_009647 [Antrodia cinnamomea]